MRFASDVPAAYWLTQRLLWVLVRVLARLDIQGQEHVPLSGPLIIAPNHIHSFDVPIVGLAIPRRVAILAADKWRDTIGGWVMERITRVVYVARGEADREALTELLALLRRGESVAVAPEGTRSRTFELQAGKDGATYLASRAHAAILPVAVWGHETALADWRRLRRPLIHVCIAEPLRLPPNARTARAQELHDHTDRLMLTLAGMLPPAYRGIYRERLMPSSETMSVPG